MTIKLQFKPFSFDEVQAITGAESKHMDLWGQTVLGGPRVGEDRISVGFDDIQTFAIFVGTKYLHEGCPIGGATAVVRLIGNCSMQQINAAIQVGNIIAVPYELVSSDNPRDKKDAFIPIDTSRPIEQRLRLDRFLAEFWDRVRKVFPKG